MSRYHAFFVLFMIASLIVAGWLLFAFIHFADAGFDCADLTSEWEACAKAARLPIAGKAIAVVGVWSIGLWLLLRERKKQ